MVKGDKPIAVEREQNISVTGWKTQRQTGTGDFKNVSIQVGYATKETKNLPKEQRQYIDKTISIRYEQIKMLIALLEKVADKMKD